MSKKISGSQPENVCAKFTVDSLFNMHAYSTNKLRARLFNLIDGSTTDEKQRQSLKGLIKDFTADAHYGFNRELRTYLQMCNMLGDEYYDTPVPSGLENEPKLDNY